MSELVEDDPLPTALTGITHVDPVPTGLHRVEPDVAAARKHVAAAGVQATVEVDIGAGNGEAGLVVAIDGPLDQLMATLLVGVDRDPVGAGSGLGSDRSGSCNRFFGRREGGAEEADCQQDRDEEGSSAVHARNISEAPQEPFTDPGTHLNRPSRLLLKTL
jgi:hypothetical protein